MVNKETAKKVTYVKLHGGNAFIPGIGNFTETLPPKDKNIQLDMYVHDQGVYLEAGFKGVKAKALIPWANIQIAVVG